MLLNIRSYVSWSPPAGRLISTRTVSAIPEVLPQPVAGLAGGTVAEAKISAAGGVLVLAFTFTALGVGDSARLAFGAAARGVPSVLPLSVAKA